MEDAQAELVRDPEELEGSLFLPVATAVPRPVVVETVAVAMGATPTTYFNYETAETEDQQQQQPLLAEQQAIAIPSTSFEVSPDGSSNNQEHGAFRLGNRMGVIAAEEERDAIRRANRKVYAQDYFAQQQAKVANSRARLRAQEERLAVRGRNHGSSSSNGATTAHAVAGAAGGYELELWQQEQASLRDDRDAACARSGSDDNGNKNKSSSSCSITQQSSSDSKREYNVGGGYQVSDYQIGSYDTNEYKVSEYKSVYD